MDKITNLARWVVFCLVLSGSSCPHNPDCVTPLNVVRNRSTSDVRFMAYLEGDITVDTVLAKNGGVSQNLGFVLSNDSVSFTRLDDNRVKIFRSSRFGESNFTPNHFYGIWDEESHCQYFYTLRDADFD